MVAVVVIVVVVIVVALLIHHAEVSSGKNSLKNYTANVDTLMTASNNNGIQMFNDLEGGQLSTSSGEQTLELQLTKVLGNARNELAQAKSYSAPGQLAAAQTSLIQLMQLRYDGIGYVANNIEPAAETKYSKAAVGQIAQGMYMLVGSDVIYKSFVTPDLAKALNNAGIVIGGTSGAQINAGQIITDLGWTNIKFIGEKIGATLPTSAVNTIVPGAIQGHSLTEVTVAGTELSEDLTNDISASPPPTFTLSFTNGGTVDENDVVCKVTVEGLSDTGTTTVPITRAGQSYTCSVTLPTSPLSSSFHVKAQILKVPGETNLKNNSMTFPVDFN